MDELLKFSYTESMKERVTMNKRGTITIPSKLREEFGLKPNDELIIEGTQDGLLLRPSVAVPIELYTDDRIAEFCEDDDAIGRLLPPK